MKKEFEEVFTICPVAGLQLFLHFISNGTLFYNNGHLFRLYDVWKTISVERVI